MSLEDIAKKISENTLNKSMISVLGGGDTVSAINKSGMNLSFTHLSTAGGAFLEYILRVKIYQESVC